MKLWIDRVRIGSMSRSVILHAASRVAITEGLEALSTRRVATEAGYSRGAVQHHFPAIELLRNAVLEEWCEDLGEVVLIPARQCSNGVGRVWAAVEGWLAWSAARPLPFQALTPLARRAQAFNSVDCLAAEWFELTRAAIARACFLGELRPETDPVVLAFRIHCLIWSPTWAWSALSRDDFLEVIARDVYAALIGAGASPGLLPELTPRLEMIRDVARRLTPESPRPDPTAPRLSGEDGHLRQAFEDFLAPDDPERMIWEERHGLPTRSQPLPSEPIWWLRGQEASASAQPEMARSDIEDGGAGGASDESLFPPETDE